MNARISSALPRQNLVLLDLVIELATDDNQDDQEHEKAKANERRNDQNAPPEQSGESNALTTPISAQTQAKALARASRPAHLADLSRRR